MPETDKSFVYFVRSHPTDLIKIGVTTSLSRRLRELYYSDGPIRIVATVPGSFDTERALHRWLRNDQDHGEWYRQSEAVLAAASTAQLLTASSADYEQTRREMLRVVELSIAQTGTAPFE